mmetsp:Transcript_51178/g.92155  ORF Transcript_51178/g.92155 Transcript_51178/m.92155 type:complete len:392 (-) Transcript_51178:1042-2217(-)
MSLPLDGGTYTSGMLPSSSRPPAAVAPLPAPSEPATSLEERAEELEDSALRSLRRRTEAASTVASLRTAAAKNEGEPLPCSASDIRTASKIDSMSAGRRTGDPGLVVVAAGTFGLFGTAFVLEVLVDVVLLVPLPRRLLQQLPPALLASPTVGSATLPSVSSKSVFPEAFSSFTSSSSAAAASSSSASSLGLLPLLPLAPLAVRSRRFCLSFFPLSFFFFAFCCSASSSAISAFSALKASLSAERLSSASARPLSAQTSCSTADNVAVGGSPPAPKTSKSMQIPCAFRQCSHSATASVSGSSWQGLICSTTRKAACQQARRNSSASLLRPLVSASCKRRCAQTVEVALRASVSIMRSTSSSNGPRQTSTPVGNASLASANTRPRSMRAISC